MVWHCVSILMKTHPNATALWLLATLLSLSLFLMFPWFRGEGGYMFPPHSWITLLHWRLPRPIILQSSASNSVPLMSLLVQSSHIKRSLPLSWCTYSILGRQASFNLLTCPAHFIRLCTNLPFRHFCMEQLLPQIIHLPPSDHPSSSGQLSSLLQWGTVLKKMPLDGAT